MKRKEPKPPAVRSIVWLGVAVPYQPGCHMSAEKSGQGNASTLVAQNIVAKRQLRRRVAAYPSRKYPAMRRAAEIPTAGWRRLVSAIIIRVIELSCHKAPATTTCARAPIATSLPGLNRPAEVSTIAGSSFIRGFWTPNENKMSDGHRERAWTEAKGL